MKKTLQILLLATTCLLFTVNKASSQALGITINYAGDTMWTWPIPCQVPDSVAMYVYGSAGGYLPTDSVSIYVSFGDGNDTTFMEPISQSYFYSYFPHVYTLPGIYSLLFIVTGPDGDADTVVQNNSVAVADQCGNLTGNVYLDANNDCTYNLGDTELQWYHVRLWYNGTLLQTAYTDASGNYSFNAPTGYTYTVDVVHPSLNLTTTCPASGSYTISTLPAPNTNFGVTCSQSGFDLSGMMNGWGVRPGLPGTFYFQYWNSSCQTTSGTVTITLPAGLSYVTANPLPTNVVGNVLTYNVAQFNMINSYYPYSYNYIQVLGAPTLVIGDTLCVDMVIDPQTGDLNPADNIIQCCVPVRNSCDPNEKSETHAGWTSGSILPGTELDYTIFFQNVGNDVAFNINVVDTLDSNLDVNTLQIVSSSHPMKPFVLDNNIMKFLFMDINLAAVSVNEPASHGFVRYRISPKANLAQGTTIENNAHIFFDFNEAIITNTVTDIIDLTLSIQNSESASFEFFPNPTTDFVTVKTGTDKPVSLIIFDISGKEVINQQVKDGEQIALGNLAGGLYSMIIMTETKQLKSKLVITKQ